MASPTKKTWNKRNHRDAKLLKKRQAHVRRVEEKRLHEMDKNLKG